MDNVYEFYDLEAKLKHSRLEEYFVKLLELKVQKEQLKLYLCSIISIEFCQFPNSQELALNRIWDLCEDDDFHIRKNGILALKVLAPKFPSRIADVLWQFMQSQLQEEVVVVKQILTFMLSQFTLETLEAFVHQTSINQDIRDASIDFLIQNFPKNYNKISDSFIKSLLAVQFNEEEFLKIYKLSQTLFLDLESKGRMVSNLLQFKIHDFHQVLKRANGCLAFFKQGVSSTAFLESLYGFWVEQLTTEFGQLKHLHALMLFADLISFQKEDGQYVCLFPELLLKYYSNGLRDEESCLMAEPIVYCMHQCVVSSPDRYAGENVVLGVLRHIFASSQTCRDKLYSKLQTYEKLDIKSLQIIKVSCNLLI